MFVIYGWRAMGKVDEIENQYAVTKFFHVFWLPLVPYQSVWILDHASGAGHETKLNGKSIAVGYARWWGFILGGICALVAPQTASLGLGVAAATLLGVGAASFRWGRARGESARRISDANLAAFKTRCEPRLLPEELRDELRGQTARMWAEVADGKTPNDVARFGASDPRQALLAYAQLRLSVGKLSPPGAREAEADARRILEDVRELPAAEPYRERPGAS